jgi:hypothetical protein
MASQPSGLLILDANVLIDYCATDRTMPLPPRVVGVTKTWQKPMR